MVPLTRADVVVVDADVDGVHTDVAITAGLIVGIGTELHRRVAASKRVAALGRALLPGLHDHHLHLLAMAAAGRSVDLERCSVSTPTEFATAVRQASAAVSPHDSLRVIGYHESTMGVLDRWVLDSLGARVPLRVQHRSGVMWVLDSHLLERLPTQLPEGAELDAAGRPTGRFFRADTWLRQHLPPSPIPDLAPVGQRLAARGVTGVTDMTPFESASDLMILAAARRSGALPQHVVATGGAALGGIEFPLELAVGPVKVILDEVDLPSLDELIDRIRWIHDRGRAVAIHCIGRVTLTLIVAALDAAGTVSGDRLEHASVVPPEFYGVLRTLGCTVVTQPAFLRSRGDHYLHDVDPDDVPHLWPCGSLIRAGIPVGCSTDAPYGPSDPWQVIAAAVDRTTAHGHSIGASERLDASEALARMLSPLDNPGGPPRRIAIGAVADLMLLDRPLADVLRGPEKVEVLETWIGGVPHFSPDTHSSV